MTIKYGKFELDASNLSPREAEIAIRRAQGVSHKTIANELGITEHRSRAIATRIKDKILPPTYAVRKNEDLIVALLESSALRMVTVRLLLAASTLEYQWIATLLRQFSGIDLVPASRRLSCLPAPQVPTHCQPRWPRCRTH